MFEPWIVLTLIASLIQNARSVMQKNLAPQLSVSGVTFARFLFGFPLVLTILSVAHQNIGGAFPTPSGLFFVYAIVGGLCQVLGNLVFINLVGFANFTISTTYSKTETVLAALLAFIVVGDVLSTLGLGGVLVTFLGVMVIAAGREKLTLRSLLFSVTDKAALYGMAVGGTYAVASTCYRAASLSLGGEGFIVQAVYSLAWVTFFQVLLTGTWLALKSPHVLRIVVQHWRKGVWLGLTGATASACWYGAFATQKAAYVLALGHIELIFTYLSSRFIFKERANVVETAGILITVSGILCVALAT